LNTNISQCNAATCSRCGRIFNDYFIANDQSTCEIIPKIGQRLAK